MELTLNRFAAGLVGVAMVAGLGFAFAAERAHAITLSELVELFIALDVIPADKAVEARAVLQGQGATTPTTPSLPATMTCSFTRNLSSGATGQDVMDLQKLLNAKGFTVSAMGAGAPGQETSYYGPATAAAVAAMQTAFASEILAPLGLTQGTGFFGASTRAKANQLCAEAATPTTPTVPPTPTVPILPGDDDDDMDDDDDTTPSLSRSEASIDNFQVLGSPANETVYEGEEDVEVMGFEFEVKDGDIVVNRLDVIFKSAAADPWRVFETVSLWADGEKVAEVDADRSGDWSRTAANTYRVRFSGLDLLVYEDEMPEMIVAVTLQGVVRNVSNAQAWEVWIPTNGLRSRDGAGLDQYAPVEATEPVDLTVDSVTGSGSLRGKVDASNPKASVIRVDTSATTRNVDVLVFELEARDSAMDLRSISFAMDDINPRAYKKVVSAFKVTIGGKTYTARTIDVPNATATTSEATITIDLRDRNDMISMSKGQKLKGTVSLDFLKQDDQSTYASGQQVKVSLTAASAEFSNGVIDPTTGQTAVGESHQLLSEGVYAEIVSKASSASSDAGVNVQGTYTLKFDVSAFDGDFYFEKTAAALTTIAASTTHGVMYRVYNTTDANATTTGATLSSSITSTADTDSGGRYVVRDGETKQFTLTVVFTPDAAGAGDFYRVEVLGLNYFALPTSGASSLHTASPAQDFQTDPRQLND